MTKTETIKKLEKKYNCYIDRLPFFNSLTMEEGESFTIYAKDNCKWDNVIGYRSLIRTLAEDKEKLARLANLQAMIDKGY